MTIEDLQQQIEQMKTDFEAEKTKLKAKNTELIDREKAAKAKAQEAEDAREEAAEQAATKSGDIEQLRTSLTAKHQKELKALHDRIDVLKAGEAAYKVDAVVSDAIAKAGVLPVHTDILTSYLKNGASVGDDGEARVGDQSLTDHLAAFFKSDVAKSYIAAPANSGGGASGSSTAATSYSKAPATQAEWDAFMSDTKIDHNKIIESWGTNL